VLDRAGSRAGWTVLVLAGSLASVLLLLGVHPGLAGPGAGWPSSATSERTPATDQQSPAPGVELAVSARPDAGPATSARSRGGELRVAPVQPGGSVRSWWDHPATLPVLPGVVSAPVAGDVVGADRGARVDPSITARAARAPPAA